MKICFDCHHVGHESEFLNYDADDNLVQCCPHCGSENTGNGEKPSSRKKETQTYILCPFCGKREIEYFSYNSTREDIYFSVGLTSCSGENCKSALAKKAISHTGIPKLIAVSVFSLGLFYPRARKKALKFFKSINNGGKTKKSSSKIISHPR